MEAQRYALLRNLGLKRRELIIQKNARVKINRICKQVTIGAFAFGGLGNS